MSEEAKTVSTDVDNEAAEILWRLAATLDAGMGSGWFESSAIDLLEEGGLVRRYDMTLTPGAKMSWEMVQLTDSGREVLRGMVSREDLVAEIRHLHMLTSTLILSIEKMPESVRSAILAHVEIMAAQLGRIAVAASCEASATVGEETGPGGAS